MDKPNNPRKILLVCLDNLGDLVFTSSLLPSLQFLFKEDFELSLWTKTYAKPVADKFPGSPQVFSCDPFWDKSPGRLGRPSFLNFIKSVRELRKQEFDIALVCSKNWRVSASVFFCKIPIRIGFGSKKSKPWLSHWAPPMSELNFPVACQLLTLLSRLQQALPLSVSREPLSPGLPQLVPEKSTDSASALARLAKGRKLVFLHAFAGHRRRCWPLSNWLSFSKYLCTHLFYPVWIGSEKELQEIDEAILSESCLEKTKDYCLLTDFTQSSLEKMIAAIGFADFYVGHDSGPLHIAAALGIPAIGLYLPSEFGRTNVSGRAAAISLFAESPDRLKLETLISTFDMVNQSGS